MFTLTAGEGATPCTLQFLGPASDSLKAQCNSICTTGKPREGTRDRRDRMEVRRSEKLLQYMRMPSGGKKGKGS